MRKLLLLIITTLFIGSYSAMCGDPGLESCPTCGSRTPNANNCPESPLAISACGSAFTIPAGDMCNADTGDCCGYASCSAGICYVGGGASPCFAYEDFDCDGTDDFTAGSMENSSWWAFQPDESCTYDITIAASNYSAGSCVQWHVYNVANNTLPTGDITASLADESCSTTGGTFSISTTAGDWIYLAVDGNAAACADIDVTITPQADCTGCVLILDDEYMNFRALPSENQVSVQWNNLDRTPKKYLIERSLTGNNFTPVHYITSSDLKNEFIDLGVSSGQTVYYRMSLFDDSKQEYVSNAVDVVKVKDPKNVTTTYYDIQGREYTDKNQAPRGVLIKVKAYPNGDIETTKEWNYKE